MKSITLMEMTLSKTAYRSFFTLSTLFFEKYAKIKKKGGGFYE